MATKYASDAALKLYRTKPGENRQKLKSGQVLTICQYQTRRMMILQIIIYCLLLALSSILSAEATGGRCRMLHMETTRGAEITSCC